MSDRDDSDLFSELDVSDSNREASYQTASNLEFDRHGLLGNRLATVRAYEGRAKFVPHNRARFDNHFGTKQTWVI